MAHPCSIKVPIMLSDCRIRSVQGRHVATKRNLSPKRTSTSRIRDLLMFEVGNVKVSTFDIYQSRQISIL